MEQENNFQELISKCISEDPESTELLKLNMISLIKQWSRKNMHETEWIANEKALIKTDVFLLNCCYLVLKEIRKDKNKPWDYAEFKNLVLRISEKLLLDTFQWYQKKLKEGNNLSWSLTQKVLFTRSYGWMKKKGVSDEYQLKVLFTDCIERFYNSFINKDLTFTNAMNLKSYFFRILELRILEFHRENRNHSFLGLDDLQVKAMTVSNEVYNDIDTEIEFKRLNKAIGQLSETERAIIMKYYFEKNSLRNIAVNLNKSEENVRVIKYRTLKKMMAILDK